MTGGQGQGGIRCTGPSTPLPSLFSPPPLPPHPPPQLAGWVQKSRPVGTAEASRAPASGGSHGCPGVLAARLRLPEPAASPRAFVLPPGWLPGLRVQGKGGKLARCRQEPPSCPQAQVPGKSCQEAVSCPPCCPVTPALSDSLYLCLQPGPHPLSSDTGCPLALGYVPSVPCLPRCAHWSLPGTTFTLYSPLLATQCSGHWGVSAGALCCHVPPPRSHKHGC